MKIHHSKIYGYQSVMERGLSRFSLPVVGTGEKLPSYPPLVLGFPFHLIGKLLHVLSDRSPVCHSDVLNWKPEESQAGQDPCRVPHTVFILWQHRVSSSVSLVWYYFSNLPEFTDLDWLLAGYTVSNTGPYPGQVLHIPSLSEGHQPINEQDLCGGAMSYSKADNH